MPRSRVVLLSWVVAAAFFLAVVLRFVDQLNLVATPPPLDENLNMVQRTLATAEYRQAIWPVYLLTNLLLAVGMAALVVFARTLLAAVIRRSLATFAALVTVGGILGAIASLIPIGAVDSAVWLQYCDCGFKDTEIVSQIWAGTVAMDIGTWLLRFAGVTLAVGIGAFVLDAGSLVTPSLRAWSWLTAALLVAAPLIDFIRRFGDASDLLVALVAGIMVPVWVIWVARAVERAPADAATA